MRVATYTLAYGVVAGIALLTGAACAKTDSGASADSARPAAATSATPAGATAATPTTLADFAGNWKVRAVPETGKDTTPTEFVLQGSADSMAWKVAYKNGPTLPIRVTLSGDSVMTVTPEHMSVRGKGVNVNTTGVYRRSGDKLTGRVTARYTKGSDSVLVLRAEGTKAP